MLRTDEKLQMNWFRARGEISSRAVEGLNNKIRVVTRRSFGFRTYKAHGNGHVSHARNASLTRIYPQILLRRREYDIMLYVNTVLG
jgi:hypothetical protein